jgi:DNA polymerase-1
VLFFGESPGETEAAKGKAFVGPAGQLMQDIIADQLPNRSIVLDNVCPRYLNGAKPTADDLHGFWEYRTERIEQCQPKVMVLLGKIAHQAFGIGGSPTNNTGKVVKLGYSSPTVLSVHPAFILRQPTAMRTLRLPFESIKACLKPKKKIEIETWDTKSQARIGLKEIEKNLCAFDLETTCLDPKQGETLCASIATNDRTISFRGTRQLIQWWPRGPRIVHNAKFELAWMRSLGAKDPKVLYDTMLQAWLIDEEGPRDLDRLVTSVLGWKPYWLDIDKDSDWSEIPVKTLTEYNCYDARACYELHLRQRDALSSAQCHLADKVFVPLIKLLLDMEANGVHVDRKKLTALDRSLQKEIEALNAKTKKMFPDLNIRSVPQMRTLLFDTLGLKPIKKTKTGPSTDKDTLAALSIKESRLRPIAQARLKKSLQARVLRPWLKLSDNGESCLHSTFSLCITPTARLTSVGPNLQNIDRKGVQRTCLTSRWHRGRILQADYSQMELRCYATITKAKGLLKALKSDDPHQVTADQMTAAGTPTDRVTAKNINFAVIYGASPWVLEERYKIPVNIGQELIREWKRLYPEIPQHHHTLVKIMERSGCIQNVFGLTRHLNNPEDTHQIKQAYNFDGQSVAVIICYRAMLKIAAKFRRLKMQSLIILQIHDSVVVDTYPGEVGQVQSILREAMLDKTGLPKELKALPLKIEIKVGETL